MMKDLSANYLVEVIKPRNLSEMSPLSHLRIHTPTRQQHGHGVSHIEVARGAPCCTTRMLWLLLGGAGSSVGVS